MQGLLKTGEANSPNVGTTWLAISLSVFVALYIALLVADFWLMRRYAERDPGEPPRRDRRGDAGDRVLAMNLQILWFVLIAVFWSGYFLLEGFDFGVGMLLPFLPRDEEQRSAMFAVDRPGLGRQRGVARRRRRRDVRRVPGLVRDDVLRLLPRAAARARAA